MRGGFGIMDDIVFNIACIVILLGLIVFGFLYLVGIIAEFFSDLKANIRYKKHRKKHQYDRPLYIRQPSPPKKIYPQTELIFDEEQGIIVKPRT